MKKICFYTKDPYLGNNMFNLNTSLNRDNSLYAFYLLKEAFLKNHQFDLSTQDINSALASKVVIYSDMPLKLPSLKDFNKSYLILFESEVINPENWNLNRHRYFRKIFTWDDHLVDNKKYFKINFPHLIPECINKDIFNRQKLCTLISGNKKVTHPLELYSKRVEVIRWFEKYHLENFDLYGIGWDELCLENKYIRFIVKNAGLSKLLAHKYPSYQGKIDSKKEVLGKYKFAICYENARDITGYITEKIFDCFFAACVPVYWGADNISEHVPETCFIDKRNFKSYQDLYMFMSNISNDEYLSYLKNIEGYLNSEKVYSFSADYFAQTIVNNIINDF